MGFVFLFYQTRLYYVLVNILIKFAIVNEVYAFLSKRWFFDRVYNHFIAVQVYKLGFSFYIVFDHGYIELFGARGLRNFLAGTGRCSNFAVRQTTDVLFGYFFVLLSVGFVVMMFI